MTALHGFGRILALTSIALAIADAASAQSPAYLGAAGFADMRQFSTTSTGSFYRSGGDFSLDATGAGGSLRVGTSLHPRWTLELGIDVASRTTVEVEDPIVILIFPPVPRPDFRASTEFVTVSTMVGFHPPTLGRVRLGYLAGFAFVRATYKSDYPDYAVPAAIFSPSETVSVNLSVPPQRLTRATLTQKQNTSALGLGLEAAIGLAGGLAVVPEVRAFVFSAPAQGPGVFLIRPGVGVRWNF